MINCYQFDSIIKFVYTFILHYKYYVFLYHLLEIRQRTNNLRKMLLELEDRQHPVNLADNWTFDTVKIRYLEQQVRHFSVFNILYKVWTVKLLKLSTLTLSLVKK